MLFYNDIERSKYRALTRPFIDVESAARTNVYIVSRKCIVSSYSM